MEDQQNLPASNAGSAVNQSTPGIPTDGSQPPGGNPTTSSQALATPDLVHQVEETAASMTADQQKRVALAAAKHLSASDIQDVAQQLNYPLGQPNAWTRDTLWLIVVGAFVLVLLGSVTVLAVTVFVAPASGGTSPQTILAVFTGVTGFLTGLFVPSPSARGGSGSNPSGSGS